MLVCVFVCLCLLFGVHDSLLTCYSVSFQTLKSAIGMKQSEENAGLSSPKLGRYGKQNEKQFIQETVSSCF